MISHVDHRSKLETIFATVAAIIVIAISFLAWFAVVGVALLYALGVKLPHPTFLATGIIFFLIGALGTLFLLSAAFLLWYLYRRRAVRNRGLSQDYHHGYCNGNAKSSPYQPPPALESNPLSLTVFADDFVMFANLDSLTPLLCKQGLIHFSELEGFLQTKLVQSRPFQMLHLLTLLDKKGKVGVDGVIWALRDDSAHMGHVDLADKLTKAYYHHSPAAKESYKSEYHRSQSCAC